MCSSDLQIAASCPAFSCCLHPYSYLLFRSQRKGTKPDIFLLRMKYPVSRNKARDSEALSFCQNEIMPRCRAISIFICSCNKCYLDNNLARFSHLPVSLIPAKGTAQNSQSQSEIEALLHTSHVELLKCVSMYTSPCRSFPYERCKASEIFPNSVLWLSFQFARTRFVT